LLKHKENKKVKFIIKKKSKNIKIFKKKNKIFFDYKFLKLILEKKKNCYLKKIKKLNLLVKKNQKNIKILKKK